jgi:hypothetical protein
MLAEPLCPAWPWCLKGPCGKKLSSGVHAAAVAVMFGLPCSSWAVFNMFAQGVLGGTAVAILGQGAVTTQQATDLINKSLQVAASYNATFYLCSASQLPCLLDSGSAGTGQRCV